MAKGYLAPEYRAEFGDFIGTNWARDQARNVNDGGTARTPLGGEVASVVHGAPPSPATSK